MPRSARVEKSAGDESAGIQSAGIHVFISYAHADGGELASRLAVDLKSHGYDVWMDIERLKGGAVWSRALERAVDRSEVVLAVLSEGAYVSDVCRGEHLRALRNKKCLIPILAHAGADRPIYLEAKQYRDFSSPGEYQAKLVALLADIATRSGGVISPRYLSTSFDSVPPLPLRYVERRTDLANLRIAVTRDKTSRHIGLTALRGMGGVGKTVLAQALCHDPTILDTFPDGIAWVTIGRVPGNLVSQMRSIAQALGESTVGFDTLGESTNRLRSILHGKAALIVLDDVWNVRDIAPFRVNAPRCTMLFTTRNARVVSALGAIEYCLNPIDTSAARQLLAEYSLTNPEDLPPEADQIVVQAGRLPLALAMIGAMTRANPSGWSNLLHKLRNAEFDKVGIELPDYPYPSLASTIEASISGLGEAQRERYLSLAVFPEDFAIPAVALQMLWGCSIQEVQDTIAAYVHASLGSTDRDSKLSLHDLQGAFIRKVIGAERLEQLHDTMIAAYAAIAPENWANGPNDGYFFEHLARHLRHSSKAAALRPLLFNFAWLQTKLEATNVYSLLNDFNWLVSDAAIQLLSSAIRLSAHVISSDTSQLAGQLHGRLIGSGYDEIDAVLDDATQWSRKPWLCPLSASLRHAASELHRTLQAHQWGDVHAVMITDDGKKVVSGADDGSVSVHDLHSGARLHTVSDFGRAVATECPFGFSRDGRYAVCIASSDAIKIYSLEDERELQSLVHEGVDAVAMSHDGRRAISASKNKTVKVWDVQSGDELRCWAHQQDHFASVVLDADGTTAACAERHHRYHPRALLTVWDVESGKELLSMFGPDSSSFNSLALSRDGRVVFSDWHRTEFKAWEVGTGQEVPTVKGHTDQEFTEAAFSFDGRFAALSRHNDIITILDLQQDAEVRRITRCTEWIHSLDLSCDRRWVASGSWAGIVQLWDLKNTANLGQALKFSAVTALGTSSSGGYVVAGFADGTVSTWDTKAMKEVHVFQAHSSAVARVSITGDGKNVISVANGAIRVWDFEKRRNIRTITIPKGTPLFNAVDISRDGHIILYEGSGGVAVYDVNSEEVLYCSPDRSAVIEGVAIVPDGSLAATIELEGAVTIWDLRRRRALQTWKGPRPNLGKHVSFSQNGTRLFVVTGLGIRVFEMPSLSQVTSFGDPFEVGAIAVSGDGTRLVSTGEHGYSKELTLWDVDCGRRFASFNGEAALHVCTIAPDGSLLVGGGRSGIVHFLTLKGAPPTVSESNTY